MPIKTLSEAEYIAELNRRLKAHGNYQPGMKYLAYPQGATGGDIIGVATTGFGFKHPYVDVSLSMQTEYEVEPTPREDQGFQRQVK